MFIDMPIFLCPNHTTRIDRCSLAQRLEQWMNAIIVVLDALKMDKELVEKYSQMRDKLNAEYCDQQQATHKKTDAQEKIGYPSKNTIRKWEN